MRMLMLVGLVACGGGGPSDAVDAAPDSAITVCKPGTFTRTAAFTTTSGAPFHPEGITADPYVIFEDGRYRMWFTSVDWTAGTVFDATDRVMGTAYAESTDGVVWDDAAFRPAAGHKVKLVLAPDGWDSEGVETVSIARTGGELVLFHTGDRPDGTNAIGRARSSDGRTWMRDAGPVLVPEAAWEQPLCLDPPACTQHLGGVLEPAFVVDNAGANHVWYAAMGIRGSDLTMQIGHASSTDGITWQRGTDPVFVPGATGAWDEILVSHTNVVPDPAGGFHLFYQGISRAQQDVCSVEGSCPFYTPGSIGHAFSEDGETWVRDPDPILEPTGSDGFFVGGPAAVIRDGRVELFYFGIASQDDAGVLRAHLARATAECS
ncbi:MAG: hypothetical protein ABI867_05110 [Kofleriaceae bacterium]